MLRDVDLNLLALSVCEVNAFLVLAVHEGMANQPAGDIGILIGSSLFVKVDLKFSINNRVKTVELDVGVKQVPVFNVPINQSINLVYSFN